MGGGESSENEIQALVAPHLAMSDYETPHTFLFEHSTGEGFAISKVDSVKAYGIVGAPLNSDISWDLACTNLDDDRSIAWMLNTATSPPFLFDPNGSTTAHPTDEDVKFPYGIDAGRFVSHIDLVAVYEYHGVSPHGAAVVFVNTTDPNDPNNYPITFTPYVFTDFDVEVPKPCQVVTVDLNNDGLLDFVTSNLGYIGDQDDNDSITVFLNLDF